jgi:hypothetical protein
VKRLLDEAETGLLKPKSCRMMMTTTTTTTKTIKCKIFSAVTHTAYCDF